MRTNPYADDHPRTRHQKVFKSYSEQLELLESHGMLINDRQLALEYLQRVNYYRLSGYWYPFREVSKPGSPTPERLDTFYPNTRFEDVVALYEFDSTLRITFLEVLAPIELALRTLIGHELGRLHRYAHLMPELLAVPADRPDKYKKWFDDYSRKLSRSTEDFVDHHKKKYGGRLPVWAAMEILDWGSLAHLYEMCPAATKSEIANYCNLTPPQLISWLKGLNIVRNLAAHHARMFNRTYRKPKLPKSLSPVKLRVRFNRSFGMATVALYLDQTLGNEKGHLLFELFENYPEIEPVPIEHTGAPANWWQLPHWNIYSRSL